MGMEHKSLKKIERARRRVGQIKSFYNHVGVFIIINGMLLLSRKKMTITLFGREALDNPKVMSWIDWNIYIWLAILAIHALLVFGRSSFFVKKWEERQIERFMKDEEAKEKIQ